MSNLLVALHMANYLAKGNRFVARSLLIAIAENPAKNRAFDPSIVAIAREMHG